MINERNFLLGVHVTRLQAAARMAGLRWKNGDPGTDKAGIIERLLQHPSILRATIATLERMAKGDPEPARKPVSFADDFADEEPSAAPIPSESAAQPVSVDLSNYATKGELSNVNNAAQANIGILSRRIEDAVSGITSTLESLQNRRPIQFNFASRPAVTIDPTDHHERFPDLVKYLEINGRVLLTGEAGTGKSIAAKNAAKVLGKDFYYQPPVAMAHELIGHRDAQGVFHETPLTRAFKSGGLCLCDEMDASMADALLTANAIFDGNGWATLGDGELHEQSPGFMVIANTNTDCNGATMQYPGRMRLDGATIARFGVRIHWRIDPRIETLMAEGQTGFYRAVLATRELMVQREISDVNATPRHLKTGAKLLNAGVPREQVFEDCLKNGALGALWTEVLRLPAVVSFLRG
jgi:hypothetical protein